MKKLIVILMLLTTSSTLFSQTFSVFGVDASNFPTIKAKYYAIDGSGNQINNLTISDFEVKENGHPRTVTNVSCPPAMPQKALSSVLTIDISGSMAGERLQIVKNAATLWVNNLNLGQSECALTSFDDQNYINQDFTKDRAKLLQSINKLQSSGGTDYDEGLINPMAGGLQISKTGKYKKVVVFLTDGLPNSIPQVSKIIAEANTQNCVIYSVVVGLSCPQSLKDISTQTGGLWFDNINTEEETQRVYREILMHSQGVEPCDITWESEISCVGGTTNVEFTNKNLALEYKFSYQIPKTSIAKLEFNPTSVKFSNPTVGVKTEQKVIVTARNADFTITRITSSNAAFEITPSSFVLNSGQSMEIIVSYHPADSGYNFCKFDVESQPCPTSFYVNGGWYGKKPHSPTLKLTHPNGGESFVVGSDTLITWEGVPPADIVRLEYSIDNGKKWNILTEQATGWKYDWKNIPKPSSNECLVRVSHGEFPDNSDPRNSALQIQWEKSFGGGNNDHANSIIESSDGNFVVAGYTYSLDGDVENNYGYGDYWITKLNHDDGSMIWRKSIGWDYSDEATSIIEGSDGTYIVAGYSYSSNGYGPGYENYMIVKLNQNDGSIIWQRTLGGSSDDRAFSIIESSDSAYVVAGYTNSSNGDVTGKKGNNDYWVVKLNPKDGSIIWQKTLGGDGNDYAFSITESSDSAYVVAGYTNSSNGDVTGNKGLRDYWVAKLNSKDGSIIWQKTLGGSNDDYATSIIVGSNGTFVVAGFTNSLNDDLKENKGWNDYWVVNLNPKDGSIIWQKAIGGNDMDEASSIIESSDGTYVVAGKTNSSNGDVNGRKGGNDYWVVKLNPIDGSIIGQKTLGGTSDDIACSIIESHDGAYAVAGFTQSSDGDVTGNKGKTDFWVVKLIDNFVTQNDVSDAVFSIVSPVAESRDIDLGQVLTGKSKDSIVTEFIQNTGAWKLRVDSIRFRGADASAFSIVSGFPKYTVSPSNSHFAEFRFSPKRVGIHTAEIVIITQSDTLVQRITGEGVEHGLELVGKLIDFGMVNVGKYKDTLQIVTIKNIASIPINITETIRNMSNDEEFSTLVGGGNITLQPGETQLMDLRFAPSDVGRKSGMLEFHYNGVGSPAVVQLFGEGVNRNPMITVNYDGVNNLICDSYSTNSVEISNHGGEPLEIKKIFFTGTNPNEFRLNETLPIVVEPDSIVNLNLSFVPQSIGDKSAILNIISNSYPDSLYQLPLTGKKDSSKISFEYNEIDLGVILLNKSIDTVINIKNTGTLPNKGYLSNYQELEISTSVIELMSGETTSVNLHYPGSSVPVIINKEIILTDTICSKESKVRIHLTVSANPTASLKAPVLEAYPGDEIEVPILMNSSHNLGMMGITSISAELKFNPTLLSPLGYDVEAIDDKTAKIRITDIPVNNISGESTKTLKFKVGLGNAENCDLVLDNPQTIGGYAEISLINGTFKLLGICEEGGKRLINAGRVGQIMIVSPNPSDGVINIELNLIENGTTKLNVFNSIGVLVFDKVYDNFTGKAEIKLDANDYSNGLYFIQLQTPTIRKSEQLIISK